MILDVEGAMITYLTANMEKVIGHGNSTINLERRKFTDQSAAEGVMVYAEVPGNNDAQTGYFYPVQMRILIRAYRPKRSWQITHNVDMLLDKRYHTNLSDDIELSSSNRNAGPVIFEGEGDHLHYCTMLYNCVFRYRGDDA